MTMKITVTVPVGAVTVTLEAQNGDELNTLIAEVNQRMETFSNLNDASQMIARANGQTPVTQSAPAAAAPAVVPVPGLSPGEKPPVIDPGGKPRPEGPAPVCAHGPMKWVSKVLASGFVTAMWACDAKPNPCERIFA